MIGNLRSWPLDTKSSADTALTCCWLAPLYSVLGLVTREEWDPIAVSEENVSVIFIPPVSTQRSIQRQRKSPSFLLVLSLKIQQFFCTVWNPILSQRVAYFPPKIINSLPSDLNKGACSRPEALSYTQLKFQNEAKFSSSDRRGRSLGIPHTYTHQNINATPGHEISWNKPSAGKGLQSYNTLRKKVLITRDLKFLSCC